MPQIPIMRTIPQLVEIFKDSGLTEYRIRRMIWDGKIPYHKSGKRYLINEQKFIDYLNNADDRIQAL